MSSSVIAIATAISELKCEPEIKECLSALFNYELMADGPLSVKPAVYVRQVESNSGGWKDPSNGVDK